MSHVESSNRQDEGRVLRRIPLLENRKIGNDWQLIEQKIDALYGHTVTVWKVPATAPCAIHDRRAN
jgi:hypothetical protein